MKKEIKRYSICLIVNVLFGICVISGIIWYLNNKNKEPQSRSLLYSTDISATGDFDDYFDLVVLYKLNSNRGITVIVDGNDYDLKQTGVEAIQNLAKVMDKDSIADSVIIGRDENLYDLDDSYCNLQLVDFLRQTKDKIDIVTVGSLRDIAALYNHAPDTFENKVENIYIFAGDAEGTYPEYNVELDETAFLCIMNSGLNIYWIPCFQNGLFTAGEDASYMQILHKEIFSETDDMKLLNWFLYRFEMGGTDFETYINTKHNMTAFMNDTRNIWCAPLFPLLNGNMDIYLQKYNETYHENIECPFGFSEQKVTFLENGVVRYGEGNTIHVFEIYDYEEYLNLSKFILRTVMGQGI